jgi:PilZ domain
MGLSADQFRVILDHLKCDDQGRGAFEKRRAPRVGLRSRLIIYPNGKLSEPETVWLRDLSAKGAGIVHSRPLEQGLDFLVQFPVHGSEMLSVYYSVRHCKDVAKNLFFIGAGLERIV